MFASRVMLFLIYLEKEKAGERGGGGETKFRFVFSLHVFFAFYAISNIFRKQNVPGGGGTFLCAVLASEPVGGRPRETSSCLVKVILSHNLIGLVLYYIICDIVA